ATPAFLRERRDWGDHAPDPIFILGMPRAGSTLIEQILASHSLVEGTTELPDLPAMARRITDYPDGLATLTAERARSLGAEYLRRASVQRRTDR
ncbi:sulfotransferase, partial [Acinetobacter baumannii]|nr:sulfotransferase [Acinetobacter baumannii]